MDIILDAEANSAKPIFHPGDKITGRVACHSRESQLDLEGLNIQLTGYHGLSRQQYYNPNKIDESMTHYLFNQSITLVDHRLTARAKDLDWTFEFELPAGRPFDAFDLSPSGIFHLKDETYRDERHQTYVTCFVRYAIILNYKRHGRLLSHEQREVKQLLVRPVSTEIPLGPECTAIPFQAVDWKPSQGRFSVKHLLPRDRNKAPMTLHGSIDLPKHLSYRFRHPLTMTLLLTGSEAQDSELMLECVFIRLLEQSHSDEAPGKVCQIGELIIKRNKRIFLQQEMLIDILPDFGLACYKLGPAVIASFYGKLPPIESHEYTFQVDVVTRDVLSNTVVKLSCEQTVQVFMEGTTSIPQRPSAELTDLPPEYAQNTEDVQLPEYSSVAR